MSGKKPMATLLRPILPVFLLAAFAWMMQPWIGRSQAADRSVWKPIENALLKIDEKPVKLWTAYRPDKDKNAKHLLLQLGSRYLMIDTEGREVLEYRAESFERHGKDLRAGRATPPGKTLATNDWILREAGMVRIIHVRLADEGRVIEIQLPSLPDLRY
jgi:hypothetical protein